MGYDMRWNKDSDAGGAYFRLSIWGMGLFRDLMEQAGMIFADDPHPPFPHAEDFGITWDDFYAAEYPEDYPDARLTDDQRAAALKIREGTDAVLRFHGRANTPGIPLHKFGSNDGWHVLPVEAESAVRIWRDLADSEREVITAQLGDRADYWPRWIAYLAESARHDGFRVR